MVAERYQKSMTGTKDIPQTLTFSYASTQLHYVKRFCLVHTQIKCIHEAVYNHRMHFGFNERKCSEYDDIFIYIGHAFIQLCIDIHVKIDFILSTHPRHRFIVSIIDGKKYLSDQLIIIMTLFIHL